MQILFFGAPPHRERGGDTPDRMTLLQYSSRRVDCDTSTRAELIGDFVWDVNRPTRSLRWKTQPPRSPITTPSSIAAVRLPLGSGRFASTHRGRKNDEGALKLRSLKADPWATGNNWCSLPATAPPPPPPSYHTEVWIYCCNIQHIADALSSTRL